MSAEKSGCSAGVRATASSCRSTARSVGRRSAMLEPHQQHAAQVGQAIAPLRVVAGGSRERLPVEVCDQVQIDGVTGTVEPSTDRPAELSEPR
jgi:hypothetical protein